MKTDAFKTLSKHYFLGTISEVEMEQLDKLLQEDVSLRKSFAAMARLNANLFEAASRSASEETTAKLSGMHTLLGLATAALIVLGSVFLWLLGEGPHTIARIVELGGTLRWTGDGGEVNESLTKGQALSGGTLESLAAGSWAEVRFEDGSRMTVSGKSAMTISQNHQGKVIRLREGNLSADVMTQPAGEPMRVITSSAEALVLGTQFNVRTDSASTRLTVNEGLVRVTRLGYGSVQEVPADHLVVATLDTRESFHAVRRETSVFTWRSSLPTGVSYGDWKPRTDGAPGRLRARPILWKEQGEHLVLFLASLSPSADASQPTVLLKEGVRIRVNGHLEESGPVIFGLTTQRVGGGFGGKYVLERHLAGTTEGSETFEVTLPITHFSPQEAAFPASPIGHELVDWWALTINKEAGLEIISVELQSP